ncbi:MAG: hypothetical protein JNM93_09675 [Bacteriovoracaceae bacterium]|nr:hypothetical protein [Bacteriovoracaceae bacterium]
MKKIFPIFPKIFFSFIVLMTLFASAGHADYSMRRCLLLPITDSVGGGIAYKVHEEIELYLKTTSWCFYESNSDLISIFSKYRENLKKYLKTQEVLKVSADKSKAGSLIRIDLISHISGIEVQMDIVGDNGEDLYFSEKVLINKDDIEMIVQTLKNWLELYERNIPYDGRIIGILGDQITIDIGKNYRVAVGDEFTIKRPQAKKRHPLLKRIVEWETLMLAKGKVFSISDKQALGVVKLYTSAERLSVDDWVRVEKVQAEDKMQNMDYPEIKASEFGKLGTLGINLELSKSEAATVAPTNKSVSAMILGMSVDSEVWVTREYFGMFEFGRRFGSLSKRSGALTDDSVSTTEGTFKLMGGYKYLPLGFFYGPQIDFLAGYGTYTYNLETVAADGFGENEFGGIIMGIRASIPIQRIFRGFVRAEIMPFPKFKESTTTFGGSKSESSIQMEIGGSYQYNPLITLDGSIQMTNNKASFSGANTDLNYKSTAFKFGGSFSF